MAERVHEKRIRHLTDQAPAPGPIVCWLDRDHRVQDNWALLYARELASQLQQPLGVAIAPYRERVGKNARQAAFLVDGWQRMAADLERLNIPLYVLTGEIESKLPALLSRLKAGALVADYSPLKPARRRIEAIRKKVDLAIHQVDAHNIIPVWVCSDKQEYAAYTLRPKVNRLLNEFLTDFPTLGRQQRKWNQSVPAPDWPAVARLMGADSDALAATDFTPGTDAARYRLDRFLHQRLSKYDERRNDPTVDAQSDLSPYLNSGQLSAQRVALEAQRLDKQVKSQEAFLEELVVRRELSENYCHYNHDYDSSDSFPDWAKKTLQEHQSDPRAYLYSKAQWEKAATHDALWNASQQELLRTGKLHGYMRMYWAKKLLEWSATPDDAFRIGIYLNDKYELDGNDPNGFVGVAWSIGGVHDRPWTERDVFGKVRYMTSSNTARKVRVKDYIATYTDPAQATLGFRS